MKELLFLERKRQSPRGASVIFYRRDYFTSSDPESNKNMLSTPSEPITSAVIQDNIKRITTVFPDGKERIEELDLKTEEVKGMSISFVIPETTQENTSSNKQKQSGNGEKRHH